MLDKLTYAGNLESLADVARDPRFAFVQADIADREAVRALLPRRTARRGRQLRRRDPRRSLDRRAARFVRTNVVGHLRAARGGAALRCASGRAARASASCTSRPTRSTARSAPTGAFSETTPYAPNSPYSASKAGRRPLVRAYHETYGLPVLITNCSNNYGPYQFPEKLIPLMILNALEGKPLPIYGDGGNVRDWLYVEDHCEGILLVLRTGAPGEKYNIGGGNERTNLQIVDALCALSTPSCRPRRTRRSPRAASR